MVRRPAVAGVFYPAGREMLRDTIRDCFLGPLGPGELPSRPAEPFGRPVGLISPHAGYMYSGQIAAWGYLEVSKLGRPELVILIGPNHTGYGSRLSVYPGGSWATPLGEVMVNTEIARRIAEISGADLDTSAHLMEHSLEVQIPFLQFIFGNGFEIVPVVMMDQSPRSSIALSKAVGEILEEMRSVLILASTDLNHYEDRETTLRKDSLVIEAIESGDPEKLYGYVYEYGISMCGYGPVATLMMLKIGLPRVLKHATSGDISGDHMEVVGYVSVIFS